MSLSNPRSKNRSDLDEKIKQTLRELELEKKATKDLMDRTSGVQSRISQLEKEAPILLQAQDSYYGQTFSNSKINIPESSSVISSSARNNNNNQTSESMTRSRATAYDASNPEYVALSRESYRLNCASRKKSRGTLPTGPIAKSALTSILTPSPPRRKTTTTEGSQKTKAEGNNNNIQHGRRGSNNNNAYNTNLNDKEAIPNYPKKEEDKDDDNNNNNNNKASSSSSKSITKNIFEARRQVAASHDFPTISTFFSYPPRDEHGFLIPTGRSSKRTAFATTYTGEPILGQSENQVNRERMKKAERICIDKEKEAIATARAARVKEAKASGSLIVGAEGSSDDLYPVKLAPKPTILYTPKESRKPGHSKTAELAVHQMPPAGKNLLQNFESGDHKFKSSRRTLFYTDYTGKRFMIDSCDMPRVHDFVMTGY